MTLQAILNVSADTSAKQPPVNTVDEFERTRKQWDREKPTWEQEIALAGKRKALGLSLHAPLALQDDNSVDPYLEYLTELERQAYLSACQQLKTSDSETELAKAVDRIWSLRRAVIERTPEQK